MSDSIKKYEEMLEEGRISSTAPNTTFIYESPDGGNTVTRRAFNIAEKEVVQHPQIEYLEIKKQAYTLLANYDEEVIRVANKILDIGE